MRKVLNNKPLIEVIFELRWELEEQSHGTKIDPHYKILIGSIFDKIRDKYGVHELLPTASMPDEIAGYVIQHRFRSSPNGWPLIQIGPGIITLNDTTGYNWDDFEKRVDKMIKALFDAYPSSNNLKPNTLLLRYINAIDFDYGSENIFSFLKENMKIGMDIDSQLFEDNKVKNLPLDFDLRFSFSSLTPDGIFQLRFVRGKKTGTDALIWEIIVQSSGNIIPKNVDEIIVWIKGAHDLIYDWFFKIKDELLRRFE